MRPQFLPSLAAACAVLLHTAQPAPAQQAQALWEHWQATAGVTAEAARSGDGTLVLTRPLFSSGDAADRIAVAIGELRLSDADDGSVAITVPDAVPLSVTIGDGDGSAAEAALTLTSSQLLITRPGAADAGLTEFSADSAQIVLDSLTGPGLAGPVALSWASTAPRGQIERAADGSLALGFAAAAVLSDLALTNDARDQKIQTRLERQDITISVDATPGASAGAPVTRFGMVADGGAGSGESTVIDPTTGRSTIRSQQDATHLELSYDGQRAAFDVAQEDSRFVFEDDRLPLPQTAITLAAMQFSGDVPAALSETPQTAAMRLNLTDLAADESLWTLIDPGAALPRAPLQLQADLELDILVTEDPLAAGLDGPVPPRLVPKGLRIGAFNLAYGTASLAAEGGFAFAGTGDPLLPDFMRPVGAIEIRATGATALIQQLSATGLIPNEQLLGLQMMIGMFATPQEDGSLTSRIEGAADGSVTINGIQMR